MAVGCNIPGGPSCPKSWSQGQGELVQSQLWGSTALEGGHCPKGPALPLQLPPCLNCVVPNTRVNTSSSYGGRDTALTQLRPLGWGDAADQQSMAFSEGTGPSEPLLWKVQSCCPCAGHITGLLWIALTAKGEWPFTFGKKMSFAKSFNSPERTWLEESLLN